MAKTLCLYVNPTLQNSSETSSAETHRLPVRTDERPSQGRPSRAGALRHRLSGARARGSCPATGWTGGHESWMAEAQPQRRVDGRSSLLRAVPNPGHRGIRSRPLLLDCHRPRRPSGRGGARWRVCDAADYWLMQARLGIVDAVCGPEQPTTADKM